MADKIYSKEELDELIKNLDNLEKIHDRQLELIKQLRRIIALEKRKVMRNEHPYRKIK